VSLEDIMLSKIAYHKKVNTAWFYLYKISILSLAMITISVFIKWHSFSFFLSLIYLFDSLSISDWSCTWDTPSLCISSVGITDVINHTWHILIILEKMPIKY
jgi:hypothetical protein